MENIWLTWPVLQSLTRDFINRASSEKLAWIFNRFSCKSVRKHFQCSIPVLYNGMWTTNIKRCYFIDCKVFWPFIVYHFHSSVFNLKIQDVFWVCVDTHFPLEQFVCVCWDSWVSEFSSESRTGLHSVKTKQNLLAKCLWYLLCLIAYKSSLHCPRFQVTRSFGKSQC